MLRDSLFKQPQLRCDKQELKLSGKPHFLIKVKLEAWTWIKLFAYYKPVKLFGVQRWKREVKGEKHRNKNAHSRKTKTSVNNCTCTSNESSSRISVDMLPEIRRQEWAMLIAVSCLSPVSIQIFMSAFAKVAIVSGTPSCSRSSMADAPSKCRSWSKAISEGHWKIYLSFPNFMGHFQLLFAT